MTDKIKKLTNHFGHDFWPRIKIGGNVRIMNTKYYDEIFETFKTYHPYLANDVVDYRPRGESGIRIKMNNGLQYDFYMTSKTVRRVDSRPVYDFDGMSESDWRHLFADRLTEKLIVKGYSQQTLADYTGLSKGSINKYINRDATPSGYALAKIARVLDCTIAELTE